MLKTSAAIAASPLLPGDTVSAVTKLPLGVNWRWIAKLANMDAERDYQISLQWFSLKHMDSMPIFPVREQLSVFADEITHGNFQGISSYIQQCSYELMRRNRLTTSAHDAFFIAAANPDCYIGKIVSEMADTLMIHPAHSKQFVTRGSEEQHQTAKNKIDNLIAALDAQEATSWTKWLFDTASYEAVRKREGYPPSEKSYDDSGEVEAKLLEFYRTHLSASGMQIGALERRLQQLNEAIAHAMKLGKEMAVAEVDELVEATKHYTHEPRNPGALRCYQLLAALGLVEEPALALDAQGRLAKGRLRAQQQTQKGAGI